MSRTSKTLLRLGVPTLAAATMLGGVPAFLVGAQAATNAVGDTISITPTSSSASQGTCRAYTVNVKDAAGVNANNRTVTVRLTERTAAGQVATENFDVAFCTPTAPAGSTGANATNNGNSTVAADTEALTFTTGTSGNVVFGVVGTIGGSLGTADILAFVDDSTANGATAGNQTLDAGEQSAASNLTVTQGGTATGGTSTTPPNNATANEAVRAIAVSPATQVVVANSGANNVVVQATLRNAAGDTVIGATPAADVTGANDAASITCSESNNAGVSTCQYTATVAGSDNVLVYVNQFGAGNGATPAVTTNNNSLNSGEPSATAAVTVQAPQAVNTTVLLQCATNRTVAGTASAVGTNNTGTQSECEAPLSQTSEVFTATVRDAAGSPVAGALVNFAITTTVDGTNEAATDVETLSPVQALTNASGVATTTLTNSAPTQGERITVAATITRFIAGTSGPTQGETSSSRVTFRNPEPAEARFVVVSPASDTVTVGGVRQITSTVTDRFGRPVQGVAVQFAESGTGRFTNGDSTVTRVTNASGVAAVETTTQSNEAAGQQTITATIVGFDSDSNGAFGGLDAVRSTGTGNTTDDECEQPTGITTFGQNGANTPNTQLAGLRAGNCAASSTINFVAATPATTAPATTAPAATATTPAPVVTTPAATPTTQAPTVAPTTPGGTPTGVVVTQCVNPAGISLNRAFITPGIPVTVTVTAPAGADIELQAYSRPSTEYRQVRRSVVGNTGQISFDVTPGTNTRLFAACVGQTRSASVSQVINVRTALSLTVVRNGTRNYTFQGRILPRRAGQLITLYRVTNDGTRVLTSQLKTDSTGTYRVNRRFTGSGTFGFLTRTGQTLTNAAGESNTPQTVAGVNAGRGVARPTAIF